MTLFWERSRMRNATKIARRAWPCLAAAAALLGSTRCGAPGGATSYPVKGRVLLADGKPLTSGRVMFVSPETGLTYGGTINSDGTFTLKAGSREGAPEGNYQVRIEMDETSLPPQTGRAAKKTPQLPFAQKYSDEDASKLTATVKHDASTNDFEFKLTK